MGNDGGEMAPKLASHTRPSSLLVVTHQRYVVYPSMQRCVQMPLGLQMPSFLHPHRGIQTVRMRLRQSLQQSSPHERSRERRGRTRRRCGKRQKRRTLRIIFIPTQSLITKSRCWRIDGMCPCVYQVCACLLTACMCVHMSAHLKCFSVPVVRT